MTDTPQNTIAGLSRAVTQLSSEAMERKSEIDKAIPKVEEASDRVDARREEIETIHSDFTGFGIADFSDQISRAENIASGPAQYSFKAQPGQTTFDLEPAVAANPIVFVDGRAVSDCRVSKDGRDLYFPTPMKGTEAIYVYASATIDGQLYSVPQIMATKNLAIAHKNKAIANTALQQLTITAVAGQRTYSFDDKGTALYLVLGAWVEGPNGVSLIEGTDYTITADGHLVLSSNPVAGQKYVVKYVPRFAAGGGSSSNITTIEALRRAEIAADAVESAVPVATANSQTAKDEADRAATLLADVSNINYPAIAAAATTAENARDAAINSAATATSEKDAAILHKEGTEAIQEEVEGILVELEKSSGVEVAPLSGDVMFPMDRLPMPIDVFDTGTRLTIGASEKAIVSYNTSLLAYFPATNIVFWPGSLNPALGRLKKDASNVATIPTDMVSRIGKAAGSIEEIVSSAPVELGCRPFEETPIRNLLKSTEYPDSTWVTTGAQAQVSTAYASPIAGANVIKVTETLTSSSWHLIGFYPTEINNSQVVSLYAKSTNRCLRILKNPVDTTVRLSTGAVLSGNAVVEEAGGGWWKITATVDASTGPSVGLYIQQESGAAAQYPGDGTSAIYLCGIQFENGSVPTEYQKVYGPSNYSGNPNNDVWYLNGAGVQFKATLPQGTYEVANVTKDGQIVYATLDGGMASQSLTYLPMVADIFVHKGEMTDVAKARLREYWERRYGVYEAPKPTVITLGMSPTSGRAWNQTTNAANSNIMTVGGGATVLLVPDINSPDPVPLDIASVTGVVITSDGYYNKTTSSALATVTAYATEPGNLVEVTIDVKARSGGYIAVKKSAANGTVSDAITNIYTVGVHKLYVTTEGGYCAVEMGTNFRGTIGVGFKVLGKGAHQATDVNKPFCASYPISGRRNIIHDNTSLSKSPENASSTMTTVSGISDMWDFVWNATTTFRGLIYSGEYHDAYVEGTNPPYCISATVDVSVATGSGEVTLNAYTQSASSSIRINFHVPTVGEPPVIRSATSSGSFVEVSAKVEHMSGTLWRVEGTATFMNTPKEYVYASLYGTSGARMRVGQLQIEGGTTSTPYQRVMDSQRRVTQDGVPSMYLIARRTTANTLLNMQLPAGTFEFAYMDSRGTVKYFTIDANGTSSYNLMQDNLVEIVMKRGAMTADEKALIEETWSEAYPIEVWK